MAVVLKQPLLINFSLTDDARNSIREATAKCRAETQIDPVPAICWGSSLELNGSASDGICLGFFDRSKIAQQAIQFVNGIELVFNVPNERVSLFDGRAIDFSKPRGFYFAPFSE